jgi:hypothetical protein
MLAVHFNSVKTESEQERGQTLKTDVNGQVTEQARLSTYFHNTQNAHGHGELQESHKLCMCEGECPKV